MLLTGAFLIAAAAAIAISQSSLLRPETEIMDGRAPLALPEFVEESGILYPIVGNAVLAAGEAAAEIPLRNPGGNTCLLTFEIALTETGESLYQSEFVAPSEYIEEEKLARGLAEGRYEAELIIRVYDPETKAELGTKTMPLELVVLP